MPTRFGLLQLYRGAVCLVVACAACGSAAGQKSGSGGGGTHPMPTPTPTPAPSPVRPSSPSPNYGGSPYGAGPYGGYPSNFPVDTIPSEQAILYDRLRRQERQKRVVKDSDRLVALTAEYQQLLQKEAKPADTERKLRDIEKLARDLRTTLVQ